MNRQVPNKKYTIVGNGKVARHFGHYFNLVGIDFNQWSRKQPIKQLQQLVAQADLVLLLISDDAITEFIQQQSYLQDKTLIHFSGSLSSDLAVGCHPLMTFSRKLYDLSSYQSIPFVCDEAVDFHDLFPQLNNQSFNIPTKDKAYYHTMCVMAGNFSQILMLQTTKKLHSKLSLPSDILFPYLQQSTQNFITNPENSATGPIERGDFATISKHLDSLNGDDLEDIYTSFINFYSRSINLNESKTSGLKSMPKLVRILQ